MRVLYKEPVVNYGKVRKSVTIPDQSLSIQEIVKRYVRGIPVDVLQRKGVYVDQSDEDLEMLSRMDFGEKAAYAQTLAERANRLASDYNEAVRRSEEERAEEKNKQADEAAKLAAQSNGQPGKGGPA